MKFIVFFTMPMQWYCDLSVLTFSLINGINECLPGTQSQDYEGYVSYGMKTMVVILNQTISAKQFLLSDSVLNNVS